VTRDAIFWRRLVEENSLCGNDHGQLVAIPTSHILMCAVQGERGPFFMVKQRRPPPYAVVALSAARNVLVGKLCSVDILVTVLALGRSRFEIHVQ